MRIRWLRKALRNLDEEMEFISQDDRGAAQGVAERVFKAVGHLRDHPEMGRPGRVRGTRELVIPNTRYLIPYRVRAQEIQILRVFHTARRLPDRW